MTPRHVLVLERDPERRERLMDLIRAAGDHPVAAVDGAGAAEALAPSRPAEPDSLAQAERRHIALALAHTGGNKRRAAELLGISRSTLLHKVRRYGLVTG